MPPPPEIILTVTNDLTYDQRMHRICTTLANAGYKVTLVGREQPASLPLDKRNYDQVRLSCRYQKGKLFYLGYNWRLYRYLSNLTGNLKRAGKKVAVCAIDLDTILPVLRIAKKRNLPRVYDAHELFTELTEVKRRPFIYALWKWVERTAVPQFKNGYSVNQFIVDELNRRYGVGYEVIRNMPFSTVPSAIGKNLPMQKLPPSFFLYQGAINEGRCFETLLPAMKSVTVPLVIAGNGNFFEQAKQLAVQNKVEDKIIFLGYVKPADLTQITPTAIAGITIFENTGLNQYYSLANRYFDYIQAGIPQLCVNYPEYAALNKQHETALLIDDLSPASIAASLNKLMVDDVLHNRLTQNCTAAAEAFCWEREAEKLVAYWNTVLPINSTGE
jgi:glycosyltransferase involved in cell wall biosynthesis